MSISSGAVAFSEVAQTDRAALAFLYEHPQWFAPIFAELERRNVPFDKIFIPDHFYEIGPQKPAFKVLFNRMSPSANSRQHGSGIFHTLAYLEHLELQGVRVLNGAKAFRYEISKAAQASLLKSLSLRFLPSRIIHSPQQAVDAANKANTAVALMQNGLQQNVRDQQKSVVEPVVGVGAKIDQMSTDFQALRESVADISSQVSKLQQQMTQSVILCQQDVPFRNRSIAFGKCRQHQRPQCFKAFR